MIALALLPVGLLTLPPIAVPIPFPISVEVNDDTTLTLRASSHRVSTLRREGGCAYSVLLRISAIARRTGTVRCAYLGEVMRPERMSSIRPRTIVLTSVGSPANPGE